MVRVVVRGLITHLRAYRVLVSNAEWAAVSQRNPDTTTPRVTHYMTGLQSSYLELGNCKHLPRHEHYSKGMAFPGVVNIYPFWGYCLRQNVSTDFVLVPEAILRSCRPIQ